MIEMVAEQYLSEEKQEKACSLYGINEIIEKEEWILRLHQAGFTQVEIISTPSVLLQSEINDINPSENIQMELFELWESITNLYFITRISSGIVHLNVVKHK